MRQTELAMDERAASSKETNFYSLGLPFFLWYGVVSKKNPTLSPIDSLLYSLFLVSINKTTNCNFHGPYGMLIILLQDLPRPDTEVTANCVFQVLEPI